MSWVALHTSQSVEPHCTLCWWPDAETNKAYEAQRICQRLRERFPQDVVAWVEGYELFGARQDQEVALLAYDERIMAMANELSSLHDSEWPTRPHVTIHNGRQTFTFKWIGLHVPGMAIYWELDSDPAKRGRGNRRDSA